jgi:hypothetical protein
VAGVAPIGAVAVTSLHGSLGGMFLTSLNDVVTKLAGVCTPVSPLVRLFLPICERVKNMTQTL